MQFSATFAVALLLTVSLLPVVLTDAASAHPTGAKCQITVITGGQTYNAPRDNYDRMETRSTEYSCYYVEVLSNGDIWQCRHDWVLIEYRYTHSSPPGVWYYYGEYDRGTYCNHTTETAFYCDHLLGGSAWDVLHEGTPASIKNLQPTQCSPI